MRTKPLALTASAVMAGMLSIGSVQAANVMTGSASPAGISEMQDSNIQQVQRRWYRYNNNNWNNNWNHHHHNNNNWGGFGTGVFLGLGLAPFLYNGYGYNGYGYNGYGYNGGYGYGSYYAGGSGHVRYCLNRYRTYNPRTDMFRGYDGYLHHCRSPYRY